MVQTIGPMVHGAPRRGWTYGAAHVAGGAAGGLVTGIVAGAAGVALRHASEVSGGHVAAWALVTVAGAALGWDALGPGRAIGFHRQTPRAWRYLIPHGWTAFLNGADLGLGWTTRIYFASYVAAVGAAFLAGDPLAGALVGVLFGATRALTAAAIIARGGFESTTMEEVIGRRPAVKIANAVVLAAFAAVLAVHAASGGGAWLA